MSWNAYIINAEKKYRPSDTTSTTSSLEINAVKGQWACFQIACVISGEDVAGVNVAVTTPAKGGDSLNAPIIYKQIGYNVLVKSRDDGAIGEWFDALVPKVDPFYSQARNVFPFNVNRVSTSWPGTSNKAYSVFDITVVNVDPVTRNNGAGIKPSIGGTYSGGSALNYHIKIDLAGAKGEAKFKWSDDGGSTWDDTGVLTGDAIALNNGLTVTFDVQAYTLNDEWEFFADTFRSDMVWVDIFVPTTAVTGAYTGTATISATSKDDIILSYTIDVKNIIIPLTSSVKTFYTGSRDNIGKGHWQDYQRFTEAAENLYKRYLEAGLNNRISILSLPISAGWNGSIFTAWTAATTGTYYNWISPYMNGSWSGGSKLTAQRPFLWSIVLYGANPPVNITATQLASVSAFYNLANANGWMDQYFEIIAEEPSSISEADTTALIANAESVHGVSPDWKLLNTGSYRAEWNGYIDVWAPWLGNFATTPKTSYGSDTLWTYLSCMSKGCNITGGSTYNKWPSHMVDATFQNLKAYYWLMYDNDIAGDVYYQIVDGYRYYISSWTGPSPYDPWDSMFDFGGDGDGTLFYPGRIDKIGGTTDIPIETLRLKALRQGLEDYEIFMQTPSYARSQIETVTAISTNKYFYTTPVDYATMATQMETARNNILYELTGLSASPSVSPSVSSSRSPSISPSISGSQSPSISPSPSPSKSPSGSPSISPSTSPTISPSGSPSISASGSPSLSPSPSPTGSLSASPSVSPSSSPSISPSESPSLSPSASMSPSESPSESPSVSPSASPSLSPSTPQSGSLSPSESPSLSPSASMSPSRSPSFSPSKSPSRSPSLSPSASISPSRSPSESPSLSLSASPSTSPSVSASASPSESPSGSPSKSPSRSPSASPSVSPSKSPSVSPSRSPSESPSISPSKSPSISPSASPSASPSKSPSVSPSPSPSISPSVSPSPSPSAGPTEPVSIVVMNTDNYAITEYTNYSFNSFCEFEKDTYYAANSDGIYKLGGPNDDYNDDDTTNIDIEIKKEKIDLGVFQEKRVSEVYLNLESDGDLSLEIFADSKSQKYMLSNGFPNLHTLQFIPGKGLKGKFIDFSIKNLRGSDLKLNEIEMLIDILNRRAHND